MRTILIQMSQASGTPSKDPDAHPVDAGPRPNVATARRVSSAALLGNADRLIIEHQGRDYQLRLTANGKLILTA